MPAAVRVPRRGREKSRSSNVHRSHRETTMDELEYWTLQIKKGRINRREFMGRAAALGVTTPKKGGTAKFGLAHGATTDTLDPASWPDTATQVPFWGGMSNSLTEVDAE